MSGVDDEFASIARAESARTVVCSPADAVRMSAAVAREHLNGDLTVVASRLVPVGTAYVIDKSALDAGMAESLQHYKLGWSR